MNLMQEKCISNSLKMIIKPYKSIIEVSVVAL